MAHAHSVYDCDTHFKIDPITRNITNVGSGKTTVLQYDHNSERFTFELPRYVEGHDMMGCNRVEVHYINIDSQTKQESKGLYEVQDLQTSPESDDVVICSWLISGNATKYAGSLVFLVRFACILDGDVEYSWNTAIYSNIRVSSGIYNSEEIIAPYPDVLQQWADELATHLGIRSIETGAYSSKDGWTSTDIIAELTNGEKQHLIVYAKDGKQGDPGEKGDPGEPGSAGPAGKGVLNIVDQGFSDNDTLKVTETTFKVEYTDGTSSTFRAFAHYGKDGSQGPQGETGEPGSQGIAGPQIFECNVAITGTTASVDVLDLDAISHSQPRTQPLAGDLVYVVIDGVSYYYTIDRISGTTATLLVLCRLTGEKVELTETDKQAIVDEVLASLPVYDGEVVE